MKKLLDIFSRGRIALLQDDLGSGRGVIVLPAQDISADEVNRVLFLTGGLLLVALDPLRADAFVLDPMVRPSSDSSRAQGSDDELSWCVSVESREGVTTGISTADRAATIRLLGEVVPQPRKLVRPGHIFPVRTRTGGAVVRTTLVEGAVDLVRLAGFTDAALVVDMLDESGALMTADAQSVLAERENIPLLSLSDLVAHRLECEELVVRVTEAILPTTLAGKMRSVLFRSPLTESEHLALIRGDVTTDEPVLVRVQPEFTFSDVFGGENPPSRQQIRLALSEIGRRERGVLLYLRRTGVSALSEQVTQWEESFQRRPATMMREYGIGAQVLRALGVRRIELVTSTPRRLAGLKTFGIEIVGQKSFAELEEAERTAGSS